MTSTVFDSIVTNENSFTELFKNFLRFKPFRQAIVRLLDDSVDAESIDHDNFDTQFTISEFGRPDLALTTEETEILIEIKVYNTSLTKNQPKGYYAYLKTKSEAKTKGLVLIIPENYYDIGTYNSNLKDIVELNDGISTRTVYWEQISKIIIDNELEKISPLFLEYSNFILNWFQLRPIFYDSLNTTTMFGKHFPDSLKKTMLIIDNQFEQFENQGYELKWIKEKHFSEYGFYFTMPDDNDALFFGIWLDYWEASGNPVCLALKSKSADTIKEFETGVRKAELAATNKQNDWIVSFVDQQTLMDEKCGQQITLALTMAISELRIFRKQVEI